MPPVNPSRTRSSAFSLIELIIVIAILGILAALLARTATRPVALARAIACRHHLRQWGLATLFYAQDHNDRLPPEGFPNPSDRQTNSGWYIQLPLELQLPRYHDQPWRTNPAAPIGNSLWHCPANPRRSNGRNLFHYCLNQHVDGTSDTDAPALLTEITAPATLVWLFDSKNLPAVGAATFLHTNLHSGGAQILFVDGHVDRFAQREFWNSETQRPRTNHPGMRWFP